jgi:hypothetical protein
MRIAAVLCAALLVAIPILALGQTRTRAPQDDSAEQAAETRRAAGLTDAEMGEGAASLADVTGPLAFGVVSSNGTKQSGTPNWTSTYNNTYQRYEIAISGQNYYYLSYATLITPAGDIRFCRSDSVGGKLLVYCYDKAGVAQPTRFGFTTFKP